MMVKNVIKKMISIFFFISIMIYTSYALKNIDSEELQQHMYYPSDNDYYTHYHRSSGVGIFGAIAISIIFGIMCFLGIMYYFKWRRGQVQLPFGNNYIPNAPTGIHQVAQGYYPHDSYFQQQGGNYPQGPHYEHNQAASPLPHNQPHYYSNPNYPPL